MFVAVSNGNSDQGDSPVTDEPGNSKLIIAPSVLPEIIPDEDKVDEFNQGMEVIGMVHLNFIAKSLANFIQDYFTRVWIPTILELVYH